MARKKRYEIIEINGVQFVYDTKGGKKPEFTSYDYEDIRSAYNRPSQLKENIWEWWVAWLYEIILATEDLDNNEIWIGSRSCHEFTISGTIINPDTGELLGIHITKCHNYCWSITE